MRCRLPGSGGHPDSIILETATPMPMATAQVSAGPKATRRSAGPSGGGVPRTIRQMVVISRCVTTTGDAVAPALRPLQISRFFVTSTDGIVCRAPILQQGAVLRRAGRGELMGGLKPLERTGRRWSWGYISPMSITQSPNSGDV